MVRDEKERSDSYLPQEAASSLFPLGTYQWQAGDNNLNWSRIPRPPGAQSLEEETWNLSESTLDSLYCMSFFGGEAADASDKYFLIFE